MSYQFAKEIKYWNSIVRIFGKRLRVADIHIHNFFQKYVVAVLASIFYFLFVPAKTRKRYDAFLDKAVNDILSIEDLKRHMQHVVYGYGYKWISDPSFGADIFSPVRLMPFFYSRSDNSRGWAVYNYRVLKNLGFNPQKILVVDAESYETHTVVCAKREQSESLEIHDVECVERKHLVSFVIVSNLYSVEEPSFLLAFDKLCSNLGYKKPLLIPV